MEKEILESKGYGRKESKNLLTYEELFKKINKRAKSVEKFEHFLRTQTSWLVSPASSRYHLCRKGGLVEHSLNVTNTLLRMREILAPEISEESCVIVGLYHDVGKVGLPGKPYYLPNPNKWEVVHKGKIYIINEEITFMDIASRSLYLVSQYVPLSEVEAQAIRYHDGLYVAENKCVIHKESKLTILLQYADKWSSEVLESR